MATIFDTAKYILEKLGKMSTWKLQKLCYYSQAWHFTWTEKPLFDEDFQAWCNGPVCPELFQYHKGKFMVADSDIKKGRSDALSTDEKDSIDRVIEEYGNLEPYELREQTHREDPWKNARHGLADSVPSDIIISKESMGAYYGSL